MEKEKPEHTDRKRSKRHRRKRNNISDKDRYHSALDYAVHARAVDAKHKAKYPKTSKPNPFF